MQNVHAARAVRPVPRQHIGALLLASLTLFFAACGGGGSPVSVAPPVAETSCNPSDPSTADACGTVFLSLTDADGDFLSYSVNVVSLTLEKANGAVVDVLPNSTRIDFAQYVDISEFVSVATVPPGVYVAGTIKLDYSDAEVVVEADGDAKDAIVVDDSGAELTTVELKIMLSNRDQLLVTKARSSLLTLDFDLAASHDVDVAATPAVAIAEPFIVAEVEPVDTKDIRVRGRLIDVNVDEFYYTAALRPFHHRNRDFGRVKVNVTDATDFDVNEQMYLGQEGLRALNDAGQGTMTIAVGTLDVAQREFTADIVYAGSSIPGNGNDAARGNVISRNGNDLIVRGGVIVLNDSERSYFRDNVTVTVGPDTLVYKSYNKDRFLGQPIRRLNIDAISVGQAITVRGSVVRDDETGVYIDATDGAVLMRTTRLSGMVNMAVPGQVDIDLQSIDRRRVALFDFSGTGMSPDTDADPENYEVATGNLSLADGAAGNPVVVSGFPNEFGAAPPDFDGRSVVDYSDVRSALGIGWSSSGTTAPFLMMDSSGLLLDNNNPDIDQRHYIKQGPVLIDLSELDSDTLIAPRESGRKLFVVKTSDSLQLYADFDDFLTALSIELDGVNAARSMHARGHYNGDTNVFTAYKIFVHIIEP